jgi:hypothetical protein
VCAFVGTRGVRPGRAASAFVNFSIIHLSPITFHLSLISRVLYPVSYLVLSLAGISSIVPARAGEPWKTYVNNRWGFSLSYPPSLTAGPLPQNGAGREFHSAEVSLLAQGSFIQENETLDGFWSKELSERGDTVQYQLKKDNYYVVSGANTKWLGILP